MTALAHRNIRAAALPRSAVLPAAVLLAYVSMEHRNAARAAGLAALLGLAACSGTPAQGTRAAASTGVEKALFVAAERKPCTGVGPMQCLQVRDSPDRPWQFFYSEIEGFTHEPGFDYELRVREEKVANPPADGSSLRWTLLRVVSKQAVAPPLAP